MMSKTLRFFAFLFVVMAFLLATQPVLADSGLVLPFTSDPSGRVVVGQNFTLHSNEVLDGDLFVLAGDLEIQPGATIDGDMVVAFGNATISGNVDGDVVLFATNASFAEGALVEGKLVSLVGTMTGVEKAVVQGGINQFNRPEDLGKPAIEVVHDGASPFFEALFAFFRTIGMALLALVVVLLAQNYVINVSETIRTQPWLSGGIGLMTLILTPLIFAFLIITILLIPLAFVFGLVLFIAVVLGWVSVGYYLGQRLEKLLKVNLADAVSTAIAIFILMLITWLLGYICCIGWLVSLMISSLGLGAVILSKFGARVYTPAETSSQPLVSQNVAMHSPEELADIAPNAEVPTSGSDTPNHDNTNQVPNENN